MTKKMDHAAYQARCRARSWAELTFIMKDAAEAARICPTGPNAGYYLDEVSYCGMELRRRGLEADVRPKAGSPELRQVFARGLGGMA